MFQLGLLLAFVSWTCPDPPQASGPPAQVAGYGWRSSLGIGGAFTRSTSGRFQTPDRRDVVLLRDGAPVHLAQPGVFTSQLALSIEPGYVANDVATFPGPPDGVDRLVVVGSGGACLLQLGADPANPDSVAFFGGSAWVGARRVVVGDFAGQRRIAAISADGMEILFATELAYGQFSLSSFGVAVEATAILAPRWSKGPDCTPVPGHQIALATTAGLRVFDDAGQLLYSRNNTASGENHLVLLPGHNRTCPSLVLDAVAWITPNPNPAQAGHHAIVVAGADLVEPMESLSRPDLAAVSGGELVGASGAHDLVLVYEGDFEAQILGNSGPATTPGPQESSFDDEYPHLTVPFFAGTPANPAALRAVPVVGDFDGDGFQDVLLPVADGDWISYVDGPGKSFFDNAPCDTALLPGAVGSRYEFGSSLESCVDDYSRVVLRMDIPNTVAEGAVTTHIEVAAYVAPCGSVGGEICPADPTPLGAGYLPIGVVAVGGGPQDPCPPPDGHTRCEVVIEELPAMNVFVQPPQEDKVVYAYCRPVRMESDVLVDVGRPIVVVWAPDRHVPSFYAWVDTAWDLQNGSTLALEDCTTALDPEEGFNFSEIVPGKRLPFGPPPPPPPPPGS